MFRNQRIANAMHKRLPSFPKPDCVVDGCGGKLLEPRPFHTEQHAVLTVLKVHCLGVCSKCNAQHAGTRNVGLGNTTRALSQEFQLYSDKDRLFVESLLPNYQQNTPRLEEIQQMPVSD